MSEALFHRIRAILNSPGNPRKPWMTAKGISKRLTIDGQQPKEVSAAEVSKTLIEHYEAENGQPPSFRYSSLPSKRSLERLWGATKHVSDRQVQHYAKYVDADVIDSLRTDCPVDVFISHSHRDYERVARLATNLVDRDVYPWLAETHIARNDLINERILDSLQEAEKFAVFITPQALCSIWTFKEVGRALGMGQKIYFVVDDSAFGDHGFDLWLDENLDNANRVNEAWKALLSEYRSARLPAQLIHYPAEIDKMAEHIKRERRPPNPNSEPARTPFQVVLLRDRANPATDVYANMLRLAFEGSAGKADESTTYLDDAVDLQVQVLEPGGFGNPCFPLERLTRAARHTLVVIIEPLPKPLLLLNQLASLVELVGEDHLVCTHIPASPTDGDIQRYAHGPDAIEPTLLPVVTALQTMESARRLLQRDLHQDSEKTRLKFFISHAKIDGIPTALSLLGLMRRIASHRNGGAFDYFYDVEDIQPGEDWRQALRDNARNSVLIVLRTDEYENRYWCRQEYLWAEEARVPILVVDLLGGSFREGTRLPLGPAPVVRVQDGNLLRVLLHAVASHLKALRLEHRCHLDSGPGRHRLALPRQPSVIALDSAIRQLRETMTTSPAPATHAEIIYPNPRLADLHLDAIRPLLETATPAIRLLTVDEIGASDA